MGGISNQSSSFTWSDSQHRGRLYTTAQKGPWLKSGNFKQHKQTKCIHRFYANAKWVNICTVCFLGRLFGSVFLFCLAPFPLSYPAHPWDSQALVYSAETYGTVHWCSEMHVERWQGPQCCENMTNGVLSAVLGLLRLLCFN